jgi:hypothetical protein
MLDAEQRKTIQKQSRGEWLDFLAVLNHEATESDLKAVVDARCETDLMAFAEIWFPHYAAYPFNRFHKDFFKARQTPPRADRSAWASPRGSAKSTIVSLIKPLHDVCYDFEQFILLISSKDDLAVAKLKDIRDEVLTNYALADAYGLRFDTKKPGAEQFDIYSKRGSCFFVACGAGSQIRGIRKGPKRPTKVILDDLEHSERVYSPLQREKLESYFKEDVGKVGDEKTNIELVGTVLHRDSLLANLLKNPAYNSKKYQSIIKWPDRMDLWNEWESIAMNIGNDDRMEKADEFYMERKADMDQGAEVMWPEKEPLLHLFKEKLEIGRRAFFKEKQNEPLGSDERVFERILWYKEEAEGIRIKETDEFIPWTHLKHSCYGALDPASGQTKPSSRKKSDFACLLTGYKDPKGRLIVHKDWTRRKPPSAQIKAIFDHHDSLDYQKFGVETNLYRELLLKDIIEERRRIEKSRKGKLLKIPFYDILNTENKDKRIHRLEPKVSHGWILFNENLSAEFQNQLIDYPYIEHDDCLDALEMLWMLLNNAYKAAPVSMSAMGGL